MLNSRFTLLAVTVAFLAMSQSSFGDEQSVPIFSNFGNGGSINSFHDGTDPTFLPYDVGKVDENSPHYRDWAMPFIPAGTGKISDIYIAMVHFDEPEGLWYDYELRIVEDDNGKPAPFNHLASPGEVFYRFAIAGLDGDLPTCPSSPTCACETCTCLAPCQTINAYHLYEHHFESWPILEAGKKYWFVISKPALPSGHNVTRWFLNNTGDTGWGSGNGPAYWDTAVGDWVVVPGGTLAAFRIDAVSTECDPVSVPALNGDCNSSNPDEFESTCWYGPASFTGTYPDNGSALNINLWQSFGPGDYPPRKLDPILSSSPLVSKEVRHFRGPVPHRERHTHQEVIDMITGLPLVQAIDFELPFGGAVFRHVRTYSENVSQFFLVPQVDYGAQPARGTHWDWNGLFWMMSENPILLIDLAYHDQNGQNLIEPDTKRCYFIPDAHHAIPFRYDENNQQYTAPPWFDAILQYSGDSDGDGRPDEYYVWLHRRSVKYTFKPFYEDLWEDNGVNVHEPVPNGGLGLPYYAVVTKISDRYGNRIEYEYCDQHRWDCDDVDTISCIECCQNCNEKGQLKSIRLVANDEVVWTLLYTHRDFQPCETCDLYASGLSPERMQNALHSIHVYKGDIDLPEGCLTIPGSLFCQITDLAELNTIEHPFSPPPLNWVIEAKYYYSERGPLNEIEQNCPAVDLFGDASVTHGVDPVGRIGSRLHLATITQRTEMNGEEAFDQRHTLYRDGEWPSSINFDSYLRTIHESETIKAIMDATGNDDPLALLPLSDEDVVDFVDPETGEVARKKFGSLADLSMTNWTSVPQPTTDVQEDLIQFIGGHTGLTAFNRTGRADLIDRRSTSSNNGRFIYYHFLQYPESLDQLPAQGLLNPVTQSNIIYHYPTLFNHPILPLDTFFTAELSTPFFITIIDELDENAEYDPALLTGMRSRRAIELNSVGFTLRDRTWKIEEGASSQTAQLGFSELYIYDDDGRIIEQRSRGWDSTENTNPATDGLIYVYRYENQQSPNPGELKAEGVKKGTGGTVYYLRSFERGIADRPELITAEINYPEAETDLADLAAPDLYDRYEVTRYEYEFDDGGAAIPIEDQAIVAKTVIGPKAPIYRGDATGHHTVEKSFFDTNGNLQWRGTGSVTDPTNFANAAEFYVDYNQYDSIGRPTLQVADADPLAPGSEAFPEGWARVGVSDALNLHTTHEYDNIYGRVRTVFPNGREQRIVYVSASKGIYQWMLNDLKYNPPQTEGETGEYLALSPAQIRYIDGGKLISQQEIRINGPFTLMSVGGMQEGQDYEVISTTTPEYDVNGRVVGVARGGDDGATISAGITYNGFGQISRQQALDGTLTRNVYDELGRLLRVYRGTEDIHEFWGTAVVCAPGEDPEINDCINEEDLADDMFLVEKRYYGEGVTDANRLIGSRSFRETAANPYFEVAGPDDPPIPTNNEDRVGHLTQYGYDWRMRQVWVRNNQEAVETDPPPDPLGPQDELVGEPLTYTVTWYDNLDRARFVAEYGAEGPPAAVDPRFLGAGQEVPTASAILGQAVKPLSLTENIYNKLGLVEEVRRYDVADGAAPYTAGLNYYNYQFKPVEVHAAGAPMMTYVYDAKGRQVTSKTFTGSEEVARSETIYDNDDRAVETVHWERRHDAAENDLDEVNSVRTFTQTWYDISGKVLATTNYGTNHTNSIFASGTKPAYDPDTPPVTLDANGNVTGLDTAGLPAYALVTGYAYDEAGRQDAVFHPNGSLTRTTYDDLGRMLMTIESEFSDPQNPGFTKRTAYQYDAQGRMAKMAAVLPEAGVTDYGQINWQPTDGSVQVTEFRYGATVVDDDNDGDGVYAQVSSHKGWIATVHFPDPATGAAAAAADLTFTYYPDGTVASRTDANGNVFIYTYDELGRAVRVDVDDSGWYTQAAQGDPKNLPSNRIHTVTLDYEDDGLLKQVTARGATDAGADDIIADNLFAYDTGLRNLRTEWQSHFDPVNPTDSPAIDYHWAFSPLGAYNFNRLVGMDYPARPEGDGRRTLTFDYGDNAAGPDSVLARITRISDGALGSLAVYNYMGAARRIETALDNGTEQSFVGGTDYTGLDRFGRVQDLHYIYLGETIQRYEYGYDLAGNRTHARVTQWWPPSSPVPIEGRSWAYEYDGLSRLTKASRGTLDANGAIDNNAPVPPKSITWNLDGLGNWSGHAPGTDSVVRRTGDTVTGQLHHAVNDRNEIESTVRGGDMVSFFDYDANGNLVSDGACVYQYDAWGRLLQVNDRGSAVLDATGRIASGQLGDLKLRYIYDGLGRLIRKQTPLTSGLTTFQTKDLYYDGVRRVQEIIFRPNVLGLGVSEPLTTETPEGAFVEVTSTQNDETALTLADVLPEGEPVPEETQTIATIGIEPLGETWTDREYVYGPGYVDEFVAQIDRDGELVYVLQDANYNVVALMDGVASIMPVLAQYTYEPYGELVAAESFAEHAINRIGHQGLFFDRFDGGIDDPVLAPGAAGLYYNRNRMYSPALGRFIQRDPNETALPVLTAMASNGEAMDILFNGFNSDALYSDGMNLYEYASSNPLTVRDPLGLYDDFDAAIDDLDGHRVASLAFIQDASGFSLIGLKATQDLMAGILGISIVQSGQNIYHGKGSIWDWLEVASVATGMAGRGARTAAAVFKWGRRLYQFSKVSRASGIARKFGKAVRGFCFVACTPVATGNIATKPIEEIYVGQRVYSERDAYHSSFEDDFGEVDEKTWRRVKLSMSLDADRSMSITLIRPPVWFDEISAREHASIFLNMPEMGIQRLATVISIGPCPKIETGPTSTQVVTGKFVTTNTPVLELHLTELDESIGTTTSHPYWSVDREGWIAAGDLKIGETLLTLDGTATVASIEPRSDKTTVYNIEVHQDHTFFVSDARLWVHNNCARLRPIHSRKTLMSGRNKQSWDFWNSKSTDEIIESLTPRSGNSEALMAKPDGRVFQGNTRITILMDRGYNVDALPREIIP